MYMTWPAIAAGIFIVFILPIVALYLNSKKYPWGWILIIAIILLVFIGNIIEGAAK